jgi:hypothetical protein
LSINNNDEDNNEDNLHIEDIPFIFEDEYENIISSSEELKQIKAKFAKCIWKKKNFEANTDFQFKGDTQLSQDIMNLSTPFQFFKFFLTRILFKILFWNQIVTFYKKVLAAIPH